MTEIRAEVVLLSRELVRIDSTNPDLVPGAAGEREVVEHLRARVSPQA